MKRIATLDGLRGLAILLVVAGHTIGGYQPLEADLRGWLASFANAGFGVRLFFVLSGYLITHLLLQEQDRTGHIRLGAFYLRRARRILPAFAVFLGALAVWNLWHPLHLTPAMWGAAGTFTWNYAVLGIDSQAGDTWMLAHLWSLSLEAQFYLLWPAVLIGLGRRRALRLSLAYVALAPALRLGTYALFPDQRGALGMMLHTSADSLLAGCAAALLAASPARLEQLRRGGALGAAFALAWVGALGPVLVHQVRGFSVAAGFTCDAIAASWLVAYFHLCPPAWAQSVIGRGLLPALGLVSYSLYLWQQPFLHPKGGLADSRILLPCAGALALAIISYFAIEQPCLHARRPMARAGVPPPRSTPC